MRSSLVVTPCILIGFHTDLRLVTTEGDYPNPNNTAPLGQDNDLDGGRGSMVWFTQATMLMSAELPCHTKKEADKRKDMDTTFHFNDAVARGAFPVNNS